MSPYSLCKTLAKGGLDGKYTEEAIFTHVFSGLSPI